MFGRKANCAPEDDKDLLHRESVRLHRPSGVLSELLHLFQRRAEVEVANHDVAELNEFWTIGH